MNIKLNYIHLTNFKGIKDFKLVTEGKNISVYGNNAVGKTSIIHSFMWLLFDKDSNGNADTKFDIKPQNSLGQDINHLQTLVEAELLVNGKPLKLKKLREEKWVTRRGTTEPVMDGHVKKYWFDEVPVKAREYQNKVDELVKEDIFKMITDPLYFNTQMKWEERREILLEISGDATDEQVIASDESLERLTEILKGRSIDDYKLVLADQLKNYRKERDNLPPRIDELTRSLPQEEIDYTAIETGLKAHKDELATVEFLMTNATNKANEITEKYQELNRLKLEQHQFMEKIKSDLGADRKGLIDKKTELESGKHLLKSNIQNLKSRIEDKSVIEFGEEQLSKLRDEWDALDSKRKEIIGWKFVEPSEDDSNCPTCNQSLPQDSKDAKTDEMYESFKQNKKAELDNVIAQLSRNKEDGLNTAKRHELNKQNKLSLEKELEDKLLKLEEVSKTTTELEVEISKPILEPDYTKYPEIVELSTKIDDLAYELDKPVEDKSAEFLQQKADIQTKIDALNRVLNGKEETEKKKERIEELKAEEKRVSTLIAELEGHKFMLERFTVAKVNLLEDSINSQFKHVKFKLFEENITNEGVKETCIALVNTNGSFVDYNTNSNSAGKINAGIDVINSLSKFYEVTAPIFTDNAESVTDLADTDSQVIRLVKPEIKNEEDRKKYSQLVVEVQ